MGYHAAMRANRASGTAQMVAMWRAMADRGYTTVPGFSDPFAVEMLTGFWRRGFDRATARPLRNPELDRYAHVILRVAALDRLLLDAVAAGARQLVLLGAGFDTRSWRLPALAPVHVFEVDHPATQRLKIERAERLPAPIGPHTWVPVTFGEDDLSERLAAAGHDASLPTVWLWEGVVMYLRDDAVSATLAAVASRSAPGSTLLVHYHTPDTPGFSTFLRWFVVGLLGEPQVGQRTPEAMARLVIEAGLETTRDLSLSDQAALVGAPCPESVHAAVSRILVARR
jgi:methyltransferase (TIGR00027 family)